MKKIEVSESDKRLLIILLALIFIAVSYFLVFNRYTAKAAEIEKTNETARQEVQRLESMAEREAEIRKETEELNQHVEDIIAKYPADVTTEKAIAVVKAMEDSTGVKITQTGFLMDNLVADLSELTSAEESVSADTADAQTDTADSSADDMDEADTTADEGTVSADTTEGVAGYYAALTMNYEASYDDFKKMAAYIRSLEDRTTITAVTSAYDSETGLLGGTVTVNMYYLAGTGKEYEAPQIDGIQKGVNNLFGSELPKRSVAGNSDEE